MIDETTGRAAIAYVGEKPWHSLGQELTPGAPIEVWRKQSGLDYDVVRAGVQYERMQFSEILTNGATGIPTEMKRFVGRDVLYRSDTGDALSVVGKDYKVVQPSEVLDFFAKLSEIGGFELETAGALSGGKRIWALAKVSDGAPVIGQDQVRPYVLLATSYDGTMATVAKFTAIRVVCHNTLSMSVGSAPDTGLAISKSEADTEGQAVSSLVRIPHSKTFDADKVRLSLGIVANVWDRWLVEAKQLADQPMSSSQAEVFTTKLLESVLPKNGTARADVTKTKGYERVMGLFTGQMIGAELTGGHNRWRMLNAITEEVDWRRGKSDNTRMTSAWFGAGEGIKNRAFAMLTSDDKFTALEPA